MGIERIPRLTKAEKARRKAKRTRIRLAQAAKYAADLAKAPAWTTSTTMVYSNKKTK